MRWTGCGEVRLKCHVWRKAGGPSSKSEVGPPRSVTGGPGLGHFRRSGRLVSVLQRAPVPEGRCGALSGCLAGDRAPAPMNGWTGTWNLPWKLSLSAGASLHPCVLGAGGMEGSKNGTTGTG